MRSFIASLAAIGLIASCGSDTGNGAASGDGAIDFAQIDETSPYAGEWASQRTHCADDRMIWTIEERRMAIVPAMRFCAFEDIFLSQAADGGEATWSAQAQCLAEGRESRAFVFFRVDEDLKEMRVTFNDSASVNLVRCPTSS